ncbi:MAG: hypothetical protein M5U28_24960 [Sandaracinaceae bacterium]|nr:hypothetical protein [Sandaracinaceae bacterium]
MRSRDLAAAIAATGLLALGCEPEQYCTNTCRFAYDRQCDDGRPSARAGSGTGYCAPGTDCTDCGPNTSVEPGFELERGPTPTIDFDYHDAPGEAPPGIVLGDTCGEGAREVCDDRNKLWRTNDGCTWGWYQCPVNYPWEAPYRYECREDGPNGIGCYLEGAIPGETHWERCEREGSCTCEDGTRQGEAVEHCHRRPRLPAPRLGGQLHDLVPGPGPAPRVRHVAVLAAERAARVQPGDRDGRAALRLRRAAASAAALADLRVDPREHAIGVRAAPHDPVREQLHRRVPRLPHPHRLRVRPELPGQLLELPREVLVMPRLAMLLALLASAPTLAAAQTRTVLVVRWDDPSAAEVAAAARGALAGTGAEVVPEAETSAALAFLGNPATLDDEAAERLRGALSAQVLYVIAVLPAGEASLNVAVRTFDGGAPRSAFGRSTREELAGYVVGQLLSAPAAPASAPQAPAQASTASLGSTPASPAIAAAGVAPDGGLVVGQEVQGTRPSGPTPARPRATAPPAARSRGGASPRPRTAPTASTSTRPTTPCSRSTRPTAPSSAATTTMATAAARRSPRRSWAAARTRSWWTASAASRAHIGSAWTRARRPRAPISGRPRSRSWPSGASPP